MSAKYWIAQHIPDLFRNEPRNVGVVVEEHGNVIAKFFGESAPGEIDGRTLRSMPHPSAYRQWVRFWRDEVSDGQISSLIQDSGKHYRVIEGGVVTDTNGDPIEDVANYLYGILVSEGGFTEALGVEEEAAERAAKSFVDEVSDQFAKHGMLANTPNLVARYPIMRKQEIKGYSKVTHIPEFLQVNGHVTLIETVDFTSRFRQRARDHAGWSAYMFSDVRRENMNADPIALVRVTSEDEQFAEVENGMAILRNEARLVNWYSEEERDNLLSELRKRSTG